VMMKARGLITCYRVYIKNYSNFFCFSTMTMDELLTHLIMKTRYDCEEAHRRFVFASTGLAGLHIIKNQVTSRKRMLNKIQCVICV
jgi:hypothetical protein